PACMAPSVLLSSNTTETTVDLTWSGNVDTYTLYYKETSATEYESIEGVSLTDGIYTLENLTPATQYMWYVASECSDGTTVSSTETKSFRTNCVPFSTIPWFEDFESYVGEGELEFLCWDAVVKPNGPFVYGGHSPSCHSGVNSAEFKGNVNVLVLPEFEEDLHNLRLTFWTTSTSASGSVEVGVMTDPSDTSTFELVGVCEAAASRGSSGSGHGNIQGPFDFNLVQAESGRIALRYTNTSSTASWNLDDFTVDYIPACAEPTNFVANNPAGHSVNLSWSSEESSFVVAYKASTASDDEWETVTDVTENPYTLTGLTPETSYIVKVGVPCGDGSIAYSFVSTFTTTIACPAPTISVSGIATNSATFSWNGDAESYSVNIRPTNATEWEIEETAYENTITITTLNASTNYYVEVIANCGEEDGFSQPGSATFKTACEVVSTFPYTEGFEGTEFGCWTSTPTYGSTNWTVTSNISGTSLSAPTEGTSFAKFQTNSSSGYRAELVSPIFDLSSLNAPMLSFQHAQPKWGSDQDTLGLYYRASASDEWTYLASWTNDMTSWQAEEFLLPNSSESYQIMFLAYSHYGYGVYVDNLTIDEAPTCAAPSSLSSANVTETTIDLSWEGVVDNYTVYYKTNAETEYTSVAATLTDGVFTLTGLNPSSTYTWYVASVCEDGTETPSLSTSTFMTACGVVAAFPYFESFEASTLGCWNYEQIAGVDHWFIGDEFTVSGSQCAQHS
ncbi:MAG: fibronectin type III domain-containing protein, partial [Bacteroidales bacterium]|nr:fibronectin type III domain-containing protein [Bacteroidales bacterium]